MKYHREASADEAFPWVRFLPTEDVRAFVLELVDTLRAADALANVAPVIQVITEWRHTAEVHAEPELAARIRQGDDECPAGKSTSRAADGFVT